MYGFIYITTNMINGKRYIGQRKFNKNWETYLGSGILLKKAIKKYGKENFCRDIVAIAETREELNLLEQEWIIEYDAVNSDNYYNITYGGEGGDTRCQLSKEERSLVMQGENNPMYGKHHSEETKKKMSESHKGKTLEPFTEEHKTKISESNKGKNKGRIPWNKGVAYDEEYKKKLSEIHMGKKGTRNGMINSEEHRKKISEARKGKKIKTSEWVECKIIFADGKEISYNSLKELARENDISYSLAKTLIKAETPYEDKLNKHPNIKGAKIIRIYE